MKASEACNAPSLLAPAQLRQLEEEAWENPVKRELYRTADVPGFPWYTVLPAANDVLPLRVPENAHGDADASATSSREAAEPDFAGPARRHVIPYEYNFRVFAKGRWVGQRLLDVYSRELGHHSRAYYEACLRHGRLFCVSKRSLQAEQRAAREQQLHQPQTQSTTSTHDDGPSPPFSRVSRTTDVKRRHLKRGLGADAPPASLRGGLSHGDASTTSAVPVDEWEERNVMLQHGDVVLHHVHRHEIPIAIGVSGTEPIYLLGVRIDAFGLISVLKPTGLPTHATGRYQYNSLLSMLEYVLAPRRIAAWLWDRDPLMQSLVNTDWLTLKEKEELFRYYGPGQVSTAAKAAKQTDASTAQAPDPCSDGSYEELNVISLEKAPRACYRLDRVTSGLLLLGVNQAATQRVSTALMRKTNAMDSAAEGAVRLPSEEASTPGEARVEGEGNNCLPASLHSLLTTDFGLRKRYLAKVPGVFPSSPCHACVNASSLEDVLTLTPSQTDDGKHGGKKMAHSIPPSVMHSLNTTLFQRQEDATTTKDAFVTGVADTQGVVIASPLTHSKAPATSASEVDNDGSKKSGRKEGSTSSAVTVFQPVATASCMEPNRQRPGSPSVLPFTLLQCLPFTGRLHQIRIHLSSWGFPIAHDVTYGYTTPTDCVCTHDTKSASTSMLLKQQSTHDPRAGEKTPLFFQKEDLPQTYLSRFPIPSVYACGGVPTQEDAHAEERGHWDPLESEPLCYECAGRLSIASVDESGSAQRICLHAWRYELEPSMIACPSHKTEAARGGDELESTRFVHMEQGCVVFTAPRPDWAIV